MYHAKDQSGQYTTLMDFSDLAWNTYCDATNQKNLKKIKNVHDRIGYLMDTDTCNTYFAELEKQMISIGKMIRERLKKKAPHLLIGIYNIYLPHNWFYKGMIAGLSNVSEPVILATFNNDFYPHCQWLKNNAIYAYHLQVLLLSKFKHVTDFNLISKLSTFHDGIWFNRISRLVESRDPKDWSWDYEVEVTPLSTAVVVKEISSQIAKIQKDYSKKLLSNNLL